MRAQCYTQCLQKNGPDVCLAPPGWDAGWNFGGWHIEWPVINLHSCMKSLADIVLGGGVGIYEVALM